MNRPLRIQLTTLTSGAFRLTGLIAEGAYVIYSVGANMTDDGGMLLQPSPAGTSWPVAGTDIGVRVLLRP